MGPFTLLDFVGLDTTYYIANIMFDEFREPAYAPPPLLKRMVLAGRLGRKSGRGVLQVRGVKSQVCKSSQIAQGPKPPESQRSRRPRFLRLEPVRRDEFVE